MSGDDRAWGGRFVEATNHSVEAMNASIQFDQKMALEDIAGSIAHARMLAATALITDEERVSLETGLVGIAAEIREGNFSFRVDREDVHMNIEGALRDRLGDVAGRLHTARSRNDQVALDLKLWLRREMSTLGGLIGRLVDTFLTLAESHADQPMPGYTHLQRGQPVTFGHHMAAYAAMYLRDLERLLDARKRAAEMPLGSGALAATPLPIRRELVGAELEMPTLTLNSLDAVADRDAGMEALACLSILMVHTSRLAEELILWSSQEFGFIELRDGYCTGSSLMPQKKNPDIPELLRGKTGRVFGDLMSLLTVMKGLPLAYNKDMQEDKEPVFDAFDTARGCVAILPDLLSTMTVHSDALEDALRDGFVLATDLADHLVDQGVPFRDAHHAVGSAVALCLSRNQRLEDLSDADLQAIHPSFAHGCVDQLSPANSLERRDVPGGPAPARVRSAVTESRQRLETLRARCHSGGPSALEQAIHEGTPLPDPVPAAPSNA